MIPAGGRERASGCKQESLLRNSSLAARPIGARDTAWGGASGKGRERLPAWRARLERHVGRLREQEFFPKNSSPAARPEATRTRACWGAQGRSLGSGLAGWARVGLREDLRKRYQLVYSFRERQAIQISAAGQRGDIHRPTVGRGWRRFAGDRRACPRAVRSRCRRARAGLAAS